MIGTVATEAAAEVEPTIDPIAALIAAHAPSGTDLFRPLPTPSDAAQADWDERRNGPRPAYGDSDFPRGLIPVSGIRCGEYL